MYRIDWIGYQGEPRTIIVGQLSMVVATIMDIINEGGDHVKITREA